jgi:hypothetical protein
MKKLLSAAAAAALLGAVTNVNAWWGWPFGGWGPWNNGWGNDWFGDGWFDFNMSMGMGGRGWGRGRYYDYYAPYWGYPYGGWGLPYGYPYTVAPVVVPQAPAAAATK